MSELRKYATALLDGVAGSAAISLSLRAAGAGTFATAATWTPAAGDVQVSLDGGALANVTNLPAYSNGRWKLTLTAAELTAKVVFILIVDPAVDSESVTIETFGDPAAMWPDNYATPLLTYPLPAAPGVSTLGEALAAARAQGFGRWEVAGDLLKLYAADDTTIVRQFSLTPAGGPFLARNPV